MYARVKCALVLEVENMLASVRVYLQLLQMFVYSIILINVSLHRLSLCLAFYQLSENESSALPLFTVLYAASILIPQTMPQL